MQNVLKPKKIKKHVFELVHELHSRPVPLSKQHKKKKTQSKPKQTNRNQLKLTQNHFKSAQNKQKYK